MPSRLLPLIVVGLLTAGSGFGWAEEAFFDSDGVKIRYLDEGKGEAVVLIHGFTGSAEMWRKTPPLNCAVWDELVKHHRVIALDCRGHGKSDKPHDTKQYGRQHVADVVRLLDHLKIKKAHVVGYSMGATIAGRLLVQHPERLLSVVFGGGAPLCEPSKELVRLTELTAKSLEEGKGFVPVILALPTPPGKPKATPEAAKAISEALLGKQDQKALGACIRGQLDLEVTPHQLKKNKLPVLVVYGSKEGEGNEAIAKAFQHVAELMGAKVQVIEGSDHITTIARPELAEAIRAFLANGRR